MSAGTDTPSPVAVDEMPVGIAVSIVLGLFLFSLASMFFYNCISLYIFYVETPRRKYLYTYSKEDTQCCTVLCTQLSKWVIASCFPSLKDTVDNTDLYTKDFTHVQVTRTGTTNSIFTYKENPRCAGNHLRADEDSRMLLPESHILRVA